MKCGIVHTIQGELVTTILGRFGLTLKRTQANLVRTIGLHKGLELEIEKLYAKLLKNEKQERNKE
jgi:hypothetical protein